MTNLERILKEKDLMVSSLFCQVYYLENQKNKEDSCRFCPLKEYCGKTDIDSFFALEEWLREEEK